MSSISTKTMFNFSCLEQEDPDNPSLSSRREKMQTVLKAFDPDSGEHTMVLHEYLYDLKANILSLTADPKNRASKDDVSIIEVIKSKLDVYDREHYLVPYYKGSIQLYRANCQFFQMKVAMLNLLKSQMKDATMLEFYKSLVNFPEEALKFEATTLNFCKSLLDLEIPDEQKVCLLRNTTAVSEVTSAYDDVSESLKRNTEWEAFYISELLEETGEVYQQEEQYILDSLKCMKCRKFMNGCLKVVEVEIVEGSGLSRHFACVPTIHQEEEEDSHPTDTDSLKECLRILKECLKVVEVEIEEKSRRLREMNLSRNRACVPSGVVQSSIQFLRVVFTM